MMRQFIAAALAVECVTALVGPVGRLPAMGYNTFNAFENHYDANIVLAQAEIMKERGLVNAGYEILILDDFYAEQERDASGHMVYDQEKFPDGVASLSKEVHSAGVRLGAYGNNGYRTCGGHPGSFGHELQDLETWHSWGMTYVKYDNCYIPADNITQDSMLGRFTRMSDAIATFAERTNVTFQYSLCQWGWNQPWVWGRQIAQSWRNTGDIKPWWNSLTFILNTASFHPEASNFYGHNDLDLLEVGNTEGGGSPVGNLTFEESKSHFTAWALLKSPLFISTDLRNATDETFEILGNKDIIKINQDLWLERASHHFEYWSGNSSYGIVFMILNTQDTPQHMTFNLTESWAIKTGRQYEVYDMWQHEVIGTAVRQMSFELPGHGVAAYLLNDAGPESEHLNGTCALYYQCSWPNGTYISN